MVAGRLPASTTQYGCGIEHDGWFARLFAGAALQAATAPSGPSSRLRTLGFKSRPHPLTEYEGDLLSAVTSFAPGARAGLRVGSAALHIWPHRAGSAQSR